MIKNQLRKVFAALMCFFLMPAVANTTEGRAALDGVELWYETFGNKANPPLLLIMGGSCQGVLWPVSFCEKLAEEGFYVIRYDHRDTGLSTCFNFTENPYDLMDVTKDAVGLLDHLNIQKAHCFGLSMGGLIAQIMAAHYPDRVLTIAVIGSTCDVRPMNLAIQGKLPEEGVLTSPVKEYATWRGADPKPPYDQDLNYLECRVNIWHKLSGFASPFDEDHFRTLFHETLKRLKNVDSLPNHYLASARSEELVRESSKNIQRPMLIFQGSEDPVFGLDHGETLARLAPNSDYVLIHGMGHVPTPYFEKLIIERIKEHISQNMEDGACL